MFYFFFITISPDHLNKLWNLTIRGYCLGPLKALFPSLSERQIKRHSRLSELANLQRRESLFPIFHFVARDRCHTPQQSFKIRGIFCHCHITVDGCSPGLKGPVQREVQVDRPSAPSSPSAPPLPPQKHLPCAGMTRTDEEQTRPIFRFLIDMHLETPNIKRLKINKFHPPFIKGHFNILKTDDKKYTSIRCCLFT